MICKASHGLSGCIDRRPVNYRMEKIVWQDILFFA